MLFLLEELVHTHIHYNLLSELLSQLIHLFTKFMCFGSHTLTVKDSKGCLKTQTINFTQPNPILLTLSSTPINYSLINVMQQYQLLLMVVLHVYTFAWVRVGQEALLSINVIWSSHRYRLLIQRLSGCGLVSITSPLICFIVSITLQIKL